MKTIIVCLTILTLSGCGWVSRQISITTGYDKVCIDGVEYIQFSSGASVAYNKDGSIKGCVD